jgi:hypothetical protein
MCISRETAHTFAAAAPGKKAAGRGARLVDDTPLAEAEAYGSLFGTLRGAQLHALGAEPRDAILMSRRLLPPAPCADAGEEQLLLGAARFLLARCTLATTKSPEKQQQLELNASSALNVAQLDIQDKAGMLSDVGFFLDAQLRAAEASGQPLRSAFSFSGRTLASLTRLAAEHRRDALVAAAADRSGSFVDVNDLGGMWRAPLLWDDACDQMLALRCSSMNLAHTNVRWSAAEQLCCAASHRSCGSTTLRGEWHMQWLSTREAILKEGREQHNCLRHEDMRFVSHSCETSYWSLRFTPDAAGAAELEADEQLRRSAAQLRLTVRLWCAGVVEVKAPHNAKPPRAALKALAQWGRRAEVRVPQYKGDTGDEESTPRND